MLFAAVPLATVCLSPSQALLASVPTSYEWLAAPEGTGVAQVIQSEAWQTGTGHASLGYVQESIWLRWQIPAGMTADVFVVENSWLDGFELYFVAGTDTLSSYKTGGAFPLQTRPIPHPEFVFPVPAGQAVTDVYIYNLAIFLSVRDRAYLYLIAYAASLMTLIAASDGFGQIYIWGGIEGAQIVLTSAMLALALIFLGQFCLHFLNLREQSPRLYRVIRSVQGSIPARIFLIANGFMCATAVIMAATHLNWIPATRFGMQAALPGSAIEFALLSLALGWLLSKQKTQQRVLQENSHHLVRRVRELQAATQLAEEHRQLQKSMQHAQKLKTIGQMAGGIAHDFNNILATILGFTELAQDRSAQTDRERLVRYLTEIRQAGERGANLVKQLITYSRGTRNTSGEIELLQALEESVILLRGSLPATVKILTTLSVDTLRTRMDPAQLQQLLVNLCLNAGEAMGHRGTVTIGLEQRNIESLTCSSCLMKFDGTFAKITATLPTEALEKFVSRPDGFDLVIADQLMPNGTGLEIASDILSLRPDLPVIITTGNPDAISAEELLLSGAGCIRQAHRVGTTPGKDRRIAEKGTRYMTLEKYYGG